MGFQTSVQTGSNVVGQNENWKSDGFVNLSIVTRKNRKIKLGVITLKCSKALEKQIYDELTVNGEDALEKLKDMLVLDFQRANQNEEDAIDFG